MNLKESILQILSSDKKVKTQGLHVKHIALHICNHNSNLFSELSEIDFDILKRKVNRILATDVRKKRKNVFMKVLNPKTNKFRKGYYKLKPSINLKQNPVKYWKNKTSWKTHFFYWLTKCWLKRKTNTVKVFVFNLL